jgi:hypothetical protein
MKKLSVWMFLYLSTVAIVPTQLRGQVNVTTWHNDNWRTGQNTSETILTSNVVTEDTFGLLCKISLRTSPQQEVAFAQPLVVANASGMTVYVATMQDNVYVFNVPSSWTSQTCTQLQNTTPISLFRGTMDGF